MRSAFAHTACAFILSAAIASWAASDPSVWIDAIDDDTRDPVDSMLRGLSSGAKRKDLVVYNRVPKTGSSTLQTLIDRQVLAGSDGAKGFRPPLIQAMPTLVPTHGATISLPPP